MNKRMLMVLLVLGLAVRLFNLPNSPHFDDMNWYFNSAHQALITGKLPITGITASITWLHQGPLWTYLLLLPQLLGISAQVLTLGMGMGAIAMVYYSSGFIPALLVIFLPFIVLQDLTPYHTSPILLFFLVTYWLLRKQRSFLAGLFIGFLYQSHLLTFIYWPFFAYVAYKHNVKWTILIGFVVGILPFLISGPVQTVGIFVWLLKQLWTGFSGVSSSISTAYWTVLLPPAILVVGEVLKWIYAYSRSFGQKRS